MSTGLGLRLGIVGLVGASVGPFAWFVLTSFKDPRELEAVPPTWWASGGLSFYWSVLLHHRVWDYAVNSLLVAGGTTAVALLLATPAAYALARLRPPGARWLLGGWLCVSMFPQIAIAGPVWHVLDQLGGLNTRWGLILPYVTLTLPLAIWILAGVFAELPRELEDAARIDGCSAFATLWRILLPLATPGLFTAAVLIFIYAWNEFFFALLIVTQPGMQTLPVGIALFQGEFTMPWGELAAASVLATVPLVLLVVLCQRWIVSGLSAGAVKG